jgi:tRNA G18 (ribose-2'-O)-methylase SpoU
VLVTPAQRDALAAALAPVGAPVYVAPVDVLRRVVGFDLHRGAVASVERFVPPAWPDLAAGARLVAVCERVNDHENLGGIFRNAAAFGLDAVLLDPECSDPLYRRCVRVSIGHVLTVPWSRIAPWPASLAELHAAGFTVLALTPEPSATDLAAIAIAPTARAVVLLGAEGHGLSNAALAGADERVRIPLRPGVDSLNVATAAAIAFHHLTASR